MRVPVMRTRMQDARVSHNLELSKHELSKHGFGVILHTTLSHTNSAMQVRRNAVGGRRGPEGEHADATTGAQVHQGVRQAYERE